MPDNPQDTPAPPPPPANDILASVEAKIRSAESILVALSADPSVDELAAAIALTMMLDKIGKHATAIFSGAIPKSINFLDPEQTLEPNTNSLQDFIITLNKDKADHLRYKVEGEFVKIFITPYRTELSEKDLKFSRGDYNVNLVITLNVSSASALDAALAEHGRIMHDASSINITTGTPGKFADIEWSDPGASSVSEIVTTLAGSLKDQESLVDKTIATVLLTGLMAATNRFGNERTTPATMTLASKLMSIGADQRLIASNIIAAEPESAPPSPPPVPESNKLTISHGESEPEVETPPAPEPAPELAPEPAPESTTPPTPTPAPIEPTPEQELEQIIEPPKPPAVGPVGSLMDELAAASEPTPAATGKDYSSMIEEELASDNPAADSTPEVPSAPEANHIPDMGYDQAPSGEADVTPPTDTGESYIVNKPTTVIQPLSAQAPPPAPAPTIPEPAPEPAPNPLPMPDAEALPPPPAPFDPNAGEIAPPPPVLPTVQPIQPASPPVMPEPTNLGQQPAMQDQVYIPQVNDPATFNLPTNQ